MKKTILGLSILGLSILSAGCAASAPPQAAPAVTPQAPEVAPVPEAPVPEALAAEPNLNDLEAMTFDCPKAALNAAAREAAKAPSQGAYQFAYFGIVSDSHHASYEVHFKSNYEAEPVLKYCVSIYCQQGWDPRNTKTSVTLLEGTGQSGAADAVVAHCAHQTHAAASRAD